MDQPFISVIMPTYNRKDLIVRAIESVKNQTYNNWELIISDDGSSDGTDQFIRSYIANDHRIQLVRSKKNQGAGTARNNGIRHAKGTYLAFLDSDDEWFPQHLSVSLQALHDTNRNVSFSLWYEKKDSEYKKIDDLFNGVDYFQQAVDRLKPLVSGNVFAFDENLFEYALKERFYFYHINTVVVKREVLEKVGLFNEKLRVSEDTEFMLRILCSYSVCFIRDYHFVYHYGIDNTYAFIDWQDLDLKVISLDPIMSEKLTNIELYKIKSRTFIKRLVKINKNLQDSKVCLQLLDESIADKYLKLGKINLSFRRKKAVYFYCRFLLKKTYLRLRRIL